MQGVVERAFKVLKILPVLVAAHTTLASLGAWATAVIVSVERRTGLMDRHVAPWSTER